MSLMCSIPLAAWLITACAGSPPLAVGYVEGEFVLLAPIDTAKVEALKVQRGARVEAGAMVAELERDDAESVVAQAEAALARAQAQLADLKLGKRPEEIAVLEAEVRSARARLNDANRTLERIKGLAGRGIAAQAQLDQAETAQETAAADLNQAEANLAVGKLPARPEEIRAAENQVKEARASLREARWRLEKREIKAPSAGRIDDIIRYPGDLAGPSAPVVSMLPDGAVKLKLFVPEPLISSVSVGSLLNVRCDGCAPGLQARVSYVSPDPEFTPPVIYSLETRQKLVFLVEARPQGQATALQPGQIVDVRLGEGHGAFGQ